MQTYSVDQVRVLKVEIRCSSIVHRLNVVAPHECSLHVWRELLPLQPLPPLRYQYDDFGDESR